MGKQSFDRLKGIIFRPPAGAERNAPLLESEITRLEHVAHFCMHVGESFVNNRCLVRASALSFSTLLALIPMLAVAIGVTSSLLKTEGEDQIYEAINKFVAYMVPPTEGTEAHPSAPGAPLSTNAVPESTNEITVPGINSLAGTNREMAAITGDNRVITAQKEAARSIHDFVQNTRSGTIGVVGMLLLVWVAISMLANVEATFNDIWGVTRGRSWFWRIFVYWGALTLGPVALMGAYSLGSGHMAAARQIISEIPLVGGLTFAVLPIAIVCLVFALAYVTVPNTKVYWRPALMGGLVAGLLWHLNNVLGFLYVSRFSTNKTIYGSLGLLPVFMIGLYFSWVILLFGVQISYAWQNRRTYLQDKCAENVNQRGREFIALRLMTCLGLRYQNGDAPATMPQLAENLGISARLTQQVMETLRAAHLITEVAGAEAAFCPARPLEAINAHHVLQAVRSVSKPLVFTREEPMRDEIYGEFARIEEAERVAAASVTMLALVNRARAKLELPAPEAGQNVLVLPEAATVVMEAATATADPAEDSFAGKSVDDVKPVATNPGKTARRVDVPEENHDFPL